MDTYRSVPGCAVFRCVSLLDRFDASLRRGDIVVQICESL